MWAKDHLNWTQRQWDSVLFSDESTFHVSVGDESGTVMRNKTEAFHADCIKKTVKFPSGVMIWGCMSSRGVGKLNFIEGMVNAAKYQKILQDSLIPSIRKLHRNRELIFQQDGASCHTAKTTMKWFQDRQIEVLDWPSSSPDLNPIETLWGKMKKRLRNERPSTKQELCEKLKEVWSQITRQDCQNLVNTMTARCQAVIKSKGDVTPY